MNIKRSMFWTKQGIVHSSYTQKRILMRMSRQSMQVLFLIHTLLLLFVHESKCIIKPSFHESMSITSYYVSTRAEQDPLWRKIIQLYDTAPFDQITEAPQTIPNVIHHIWLGSKLPLVCKKYRQTWIDNHPTWIHILWTDNTKNYDDSSIIVSPTSFDEIVTLLEEPNTLNKSIIINVEHLMFSTRRQYTKSTNFGEKSDILRYEILFHCGGLYIDTDFKCLQAFDSVHQSCTFYAGLNFSDEDFCVFNGLIGTKPKHPICQSCITQIKHQSHNRPNTNTTTVMTRTGPPFFSSIIRDYINTSTDNTIVLFPVTFLYPYPHYNKAQSHYNSSQKIEEEWVKPESLAIHFWHVSWRPKKKELHA